MDRDAAKDLYAACEKTLVSMAGAEETIRRIKDDDERKHLLRALSAAMVELLSGVRAPVVIQYPDLEPLEPLGAPDTDLDAEEQAEVGLLQAKDLEAIDSALLAECAASWRKVARVVGAAMNSLQERYPNVPDGFYALRVAGLVSAGTLESQGNLEYMRFSEVRRAEPGRSAA
jgi:hypothetical protein